MPKLILNKFLFFKVAACGLIFSFLFGCNTTTSKPVLTESANLNLLDFGLYKISIDQRFVYVSGLEDKLHTDNLNDPRGSNVKVTRYIFADASEGKDNIKKLIIVYVYQLTDPRHYFRGEVSFDSFKERHIEKGMIELHNIRVAYLIRTVSYLRSDVLKLLESQGYRMSLDRKQSLEIWFGKIIGATKEIRIVYIESDKFWYENNYYEVQRSIARSESFIRLKK